MKSQRGFTILEVVVAVAVMGILVAIFMGTYRAGFYRGYAISTEARSLTSALNLARMRATQKRLALSITESACAGTAITDNTTTPATIWYPSVQFKGTSPVPMGFQAGDYVVFSNLDLLSLNGGSIRINSIEKQDDDTTTAPNFETWFTCLTPVGIQGTATTAFYGPTAFPSPRSFAYAQNFSRASVVVIRRKSLMVWELSQQSNPTIKAQMEKNFDRPEYYWYNDNVPAGAAVTPVVELMEGMDVANRNPATVSGVNKNDKIFIPFNSRGLPALADGYQVRVKNNQAGGSHVRWVTVSPTGRANLVAGKDTNATFP
jgi:prepilin-type N-terminal cleavage/methylation domain-containing protein